MRDEWRASQKRWTMYSQINSDGHMKNQPVRFYGINE